MLNRNIFSHLLSAMNRHKLEFHLWIFLSMEKMLLILRSSMSVENKSKIITWKLICRRRSTNSAEESFHLIYSIWTFNNYNSFKRECFGKRNSINDMQNTLLDFSLKEEYTHFCFESKLK